MKTFAVSMALLLAGLVGGGFYAYHLGVSVHGEAAAHGEKGGSGDHGTEPGGGENNPGAGGQSAKSPSGQAGGEGNGEHEGGNANAGDQTGGEGSVPLANQATGEKSNNQASGTVSGGTAQAQAASVEGNAQAGQEIFAASCAGCHGQQAQGVVGPNLVQGGDAAVNWQFADFRRALLIGETPDGRSLNATMPRYDGTALQPKGQPASDQDIADIQAHLKTLR